MLGLFFFLYSEMRSSLSMSTALTRPSAWRARQAPGKFNLA